MLFIITIVWDREFEETVQVISYYAVLTKMLLSSYTNELCISTIIRFESLNSTF